MENNKQKSMTELMAEGLNDTPSLSRRERRRLAEASAGKKPAESSVLTAELNQTNDGVVDDTPTQEYKPTRNQKPPVKKPIVLLDEDEDDLMDAPGEDSFIASRVKPVKTPISLDDDDEDDEDEKPRSSRKPLVYDDEDDDDDDDDYDDYEDDDEEEVSFGQRILGFLKGLLVIALILLLTILALRLAEASGRISLDVLRERAGSSIPFIHTLFPKP